MMKLTLLLSVLLATGGVWAQNNEANTEEANQNTEVRREKRSDNRRRTSWSQTQRKRIVRYERVVVDESMGNRDGKRFTMNATLTGASFRTTGG